MTTTADIFLKWVFPILGGVVSILMFLAPLQAVIRARKERVLGHLNPLPFPAQLANSAGWIAYSYVIEPTNSQGSVFVFVPNYIGLLLGFYFTMSCYGLANAKTRDNQMLVMLFFAGLLALIGLIGVQVRLSVHNLQLLWGFTSNAILLLYYGAPLSTVYTVISTQSAASLSWPLSVMQVINGSLWLGYGLAVSDPFIWVPNGIGACAGGFQVFLLILFRKKHRHSPPPSETDTVTSSQRELTTGMADSSLIVNSTSSKLDAPTGSNGFPTGILVEEVVHDFDRSGHQSI